MSASVKDLEQKIAHAWGADRFLLRRQLKEIQHAQERGRPTDRSLQRFEQQLAKSIDLQSRRIASLPPVRLDESLPIFQRRDDILTAIREQQVLVLCGETGSGKSTQLPLLCLQAGRGIDGMIGHTQPRRIAARSVAGRVAEQLQRPVGKQVGFQVRFTDATSPETLIKLMTDGVLLAECQSDPFLNRYDTLILDEVHERSLNIDFLLGYLKQLLHRRRDLKLIVTSATLDAQRFCDHFRTSRGPAPLIEVSGRTYPVEIRHQAALLDEDNEEPDWPAAIASALGDLLSEQSGDVLIFLPTEREIHELTRFLRKHPVLDQARGGPIELLPLYARLNLGEQNRVFEPHQGRRIVMATNVAESSLTVPGIRSVIDTGTARISRYASRSKVQRLPIEPISQASANQRAGRCGRVGPGICIRLYSKADFEAREAFTTPEIQRTNLAGVILRTLSLKFGRIEQFPFLDPPRPDAIRDGYATLFELGAIDAQQQLTKTGQQLSPLPVDPRIGRMILAGAEEHCLAELLILAAVLEGQDPRERPLEKQQAADEAHQRFVVPESDFLTLLKIWDYYHEQRETLSRNQLRKRCHKEFLSFNRMQDWIDLHQQLLRIVTEAKLPLHARKNDPQSIHRALLAGWLSHVAYRPEGSEYQLPGGGVAHLWPGSACFANRPRWVVAAEQVETSRRYLRTVAQIDSGWIERLAAHLVTRSYSDPHWDRTTGSARAYEKVSLFGLVVVPRRRVHYGPIDPAASRALLIQRGLVEGDCDLKAEFYEWNQLLLRDLEEMQTRSRRGGLLLGEEARVEFYEQRIPQDVYDIPRLLKWYRAQSKVEPKLLQMSREDLLAPEIELADDREFPNQISSGSLVLPVQYKFDPSAADDGLTVRVPPEAVNQLDTRRLGWLVPGLLQEKVLAVLRGLPKAVRVHFVPIPETARAVSARLTFGKGDFAESLSAAIEAATRVSVPVDLIRAVELPRHLRVNVEVVGHDGKTLQTQRDVEQIQKELGVRAAKEFQELDRQHWQRNGLTSWSFGELPERVELERGGLKLAGFPMLIDAGEAVQLRLADSEDRARRETRRGLRRLAVLACQKELKKQIDWLPDLQQHLLLGATLPDAGRLRQELTDLLAERSFLLSTMRPHNAAEFDDWLKQGRQKLGLGVQDLTTLCLPLFKWYHEAYLATERLNSPSQQAARQDLRRQMADLAGPGFLVQTPWPWLLQYPRYFQSMTLRTRKLVGGNVARDTQLQQQVASWWQRYLQRREADDAAGVYDPELVGLRWLIEEYRVSLFTQELRTAVPVSEKRLEEQWSRLRRL